MSLRRLEEVSQNASRAERGLMLDGWSIGLSPGLAKRSRCVNPFYPSTRPFAENFEAAQAAYAAVKLPCIFRITPFVTDASIDAHLADRGFIRFDTTLVQVLPLGELRIDHLRPVRGTFQLQQNFALAARWLADMRGDSASEAAALAVRWAHSAAQVEPVFAYDEAGIRVARSVTVSESGYVGVFDVGTLESHRNRGHASALLAHQLGTARNGGAHTAYLQVTPENTSRRIYQRFGFRTAYQYWYRAASNHAQ
jgi:GNAT superfamily N-acetyltransferase